MADIKSLFLDHVAQVVGTPSALVIERAEGNYLYDPEGKAYLDFISGISVANLPCARCDAHRAAACQHGWCGQPGH